MNWEFKIMNNLNHLECEQILKMCQETFGEVAESIYFFKVLVDFGKVFVTFDQNKPICAIQTLSEWGNYRSVQIVSVATHPKYQGQGVGTFTAQKMIELMKAESIRIVGIRIPPNHSSMLRIFHDRLGFSIIKMLLNYYGCGEDRLYLEKILVKRENN